MENKGRVVAMMFIWFVVIGCIVLAWKYWWFPKKQQAAERKAEQEHQETIEKTSSTSRFKHNINVVLDSFSGYAAIRSSEFQAECAKYNIKTDLVDDGADYSKRAKMLAEGKAQVGVFTIDALYKVSAELGDMPVTIVALLDETKGADAMVGSKKLFPNIDSLNVPDMKIVCVSNSPSETLARVVRAHFELKNISDASFQFVDSAQAVVDAYKKAGPNDKKVYITWEPYVSRILENPEYHDVVNSGKFRGYVVDVIVAQRSFLLKNEEIVENVVKAYFSTIFRYRNTMTTLVGDDAKQLGESLSDEQVEKLVKTIWWKNTQENFGHFGFTTGHSLQHIDTICANVCGVLLKTGAIKKDPTNGRPNLLYYDKIMKRLHDTSWYPGFGQESVREEKTLLALTDEEWKSLRPVGTLQVPRLVFARGTARLSDLSSQTLDDLAESLKTWPRYYLVVRGNASGGGDAEANKVLAESRARAAIEYLATKGVDRNRIHAESAQTQSSSTVSFILGEMAY